MAQINVNDPRGFVPLRSLHGHTSFVTRQYPVSSNNPTTIFPGDPVTLNASGNVIRITTSAVSVNAPPVLGVVAAVLNSDRRPQTFTQPTRGPYLPASTAGFVDVYDDPDMTFLVNADSAASQNDIGRFVRVTAGAPNTAAGISGFSLLMVQATGSSVGHRFRILALGPNEDRTFSANNDMEVMIADHEWRRAYKRVGVW